MQTTDLSRHSCTTLSMLEFIEQQDGDTYGYHCREFVAWMMESGRRLDHQAVIDYFKRLNASEYAAGTKRIKRQALKKRLRQLARAGGLGSDLSRNLDQFLSDLDRESETKAPKVQPHSIGRERYMTPDEAMRVVRACRGPRQTMIIRFLWATGCRVSEMTGIRRGDVKQIGDVAVACYRVVGKGNKERWVKTSAELYNQIRDVFRGEVYLLETSNGRPYHRSYVSNQIAKVSSRAIGRPMRAHSLRHSFGTRQIKKGVPLSYVSRYMGHSSVSMTAEWSTLTSVDTYT